MIRNGDKSLTKNIHTKCQPPTNVAVAQLSKNKNNIYYNLACI